MLVVIFIQNFRFESKQSAPFGERKVFATDTIALSRLSRAVQIQTVSLEGREPDSAAFSEMIRFLCRTYPSVIASTDTITFNNYSFLLRWKGKQQSLKPVILYAHLDVVPVDSGWSFAPFEGKYDDKFIYGRGVIDDKGAIISIMEALNRMISSGKSPSRDVYIAFGHDEELGGHKGAKSIAAYLKSKNIKAEFLMDEGGIIADGMVPFVSRPVALIATAEKGYVCFRLTVRGNGGHSSMPPKDPPVEILASAIEKIHDHPFEKRMTQPLQDFIEHVGPEMRQPFKTLFANRPIFQPLIFSEYEKIPGANAMIRTTSVTTLINGGIKENIIPEKASAVVNFRLLQGDDVSTVSDHLKKVIDDERVSVERMEQYDAPSGISSISSFGYKTIDASLRTVFPDVIVTPNLSTGGTDSKHFRDVTENIFRFLPTRMDQEILDGMHGMNEKMEIRSFMEMIEFYHTLLSRL